MKWILGLSLILFGCGEGSGDARVDPESRQPEAISVLGDKLFPLEMAPELRAEREAQLEEARLAFLAHPEQEIAAIWYGRRLGYLERYSEAIAIFTKGLEHHPNSAKLLRHRGHRHLSRRDFVNAIRDLSRAAELADPFEDEIELDGIPNSRNEPRSTLKFNIWYHLGLAYFFNGEFSQAYTAFGECYARSKRNPDLLCAATHWNYVINRRLGLHRDAHLLLEPITLDMDVIENEDYLHLIMYYKELLSAEELLEASSPLGRATRGFGLAHNLLMDGETDRANDLFLRIVEDGPWPAFGAIAAEVELSRL